ncbi:MAG: glycosyltransferase family 4 protein [Candidatus Gastranaerophilales bacterium]|nr:glycosyltransferase family 4 protein [Candidatus Gastranaerophilales bacterium]
MRVVVASKFYYQRGGLESYLFKISEILKSYNHEVIPFSTTYSKNIDSEYKRFFAEYMEIGNIRKTAVWERTKALFKILYNLDAMHKFSQLLDYTKPDLIWGFGIHRHISPSIFIEAQNRSIPVIHRLSDYSLICPDSRLIKGDGSNCCELLCSNNSYLNAIKYKCVRQTKGLSSGKNPSLLASIVGATEMYLHNKFKLYINNVDKFIAPSKFLMKTVIKGGIPEKKITHIPIFIDTGKYRPEYISQPYMAYVGRLSCEKGLPILLEAMSRLKHHKLFIIGDGPERSKLEQIKEQKNLVNVKFLGSMFDEQLNRIIRNSRLVVVPSTWYENSPHVILEAFALGKPVLGARIGGIPEYIEEGISGMLYEYNDVDELTEKINMLMEQQSLCEEMGRAARKITEIKYNPRTHYGEVMKVMKQVL